MMRDWHNRLRTGNALSKGNNERLFIESETIGDRFWLPPRSLRDVGWPLFLGNSAKLAWNLPLGCVLSHSNALDVCILPMAKLFAHYCPSAEAVSCQESTDGWILQSQSRQDVEYYDAFSNDSHQPRNNLKKRSTSCWQSESEQSQKLRTILPRPHQHE